MSMAVSEMSSPVESELKMVFATMDHRLEGFHEALRQQSEAKICEWESKFTEVNKQIARLNSLILVETTERVMELRDLKQRMFNSVDVVGVEIRALFDAKVAPVVARIARLNEQVAEVAAKLDEGRQQFGETIERDSLLILEKLVAFEVDFKLKNAERWKHEEEIGVEIGKAKANLDVDLTAVGKVAVEKNALTKEKIVVVVADRKAYLPTVEVAIRAQESAIEGEIAKENRDRDGRYRQLIAEIPIHTARIKHGVHLIS